MHFLLLTYQLVTIIWHFRIIYCYDLFWKFWLLAFRFYDSFWKYASDKMYAFTYPSTRHSWYWYLRINHRPCNKLQPLSIYWPTLEVYWQHLLCLSLCSDSDPIFIYSVQFYYFVHIECLLTVSGCRIFHSMCSYYIDDDDNNYSEGLWINYNCG